MDGKIKYEFSSKMWKYPSPGGWFFVSLPKSISKEIRTHFKWQEEGWGRLKIKAQIGNYKWDTAIWFDTKLKTYLLPIKAEIRSKIKLETNKDIELTIWV